MRLGRQKKDKNYTKREIKNPVKKMEEVRRGERFLRIKKIRID